VLIILGYIHWFSDNLLWHDDIIKQETYFGERNLFVGVKDLDYDVGFVYFRWAKCATCFLLCTYLLLQLDSIISSVLKHNKVFFQLSLLNWHLFLKLVIFTYIFNSTDLTCNFRTYMWELPVIKTNVNLLDLIKKKKKFDPIFEENFTPKGGFISFTSIWKKILSERVTLS